MNDGFIEGGYLKKSTRFVFGDIFANFFIVFSFCCNIGSCEYFCARPFSASSYLRSGYIFSILFGTAAGLVVKYWLDKNYIFRFRATNAIHDARTFMLYSVMGIMTTLIFWAFEFGFQAVFQTKNMRYLGGIIGLGIGYFVKYQMDKRFVFRQIL